MPTKTSHAPNRKCIKSSRNGSLAEAWRGEHRHGPRAQPTPACRLGQPWGVRHGCCRHSWTEIQPLLSQCQGSARPQIPKGGNVESNSIPAAVSLLSQALEPRWCHSTPWADSSLQPLPVGFGELAHTASGHSILSQQEGHLGATCLLGSPFLWRFSSDAARDGSVPLGQKYKPALLQTKRYLPLLPPSLRKIVFQVSNPSPHTLFEKTKHQRWHELPSVPRQDKTTVSQEQDTFPHHQLPVGALLQKTQQTKAQSPVSLQACPLQNPTQAQNAAGSQPSGSTSPGTQNCCTRASEENAPRGKINKELDQQQTLLRAINSRGISQGFLV